MTELSKPAGKQRIDEIRIDLEGPALDSFRPEAREAELRRTNV
jgi:hypothetical protein